MVRSWQAIRNFFLSGIVGAAFFLLPIRVGENWTVPFDLVWQEVRGLAGEHLSFYSWIAILLGGVLSLFALWANSFEKFATQPIFLAFRLLGAFFATLFFFGFEYYIGVDPDSRKIIWEVLIFSVAVIIPMGAMFIHLFTNYGVIEFVGTLCRPLMKRAFLLPGQSAIDNLTSWLGSYSVGLYLTRKMLDEGIYSKREAFIIATCFSTVSIGFVGVVTTTLAINHLFLWVFGAYFISVYVLAALLVRMWPIRGIDNSYLVEKKLPSPTKETNILSEAWHVAMKKAERAPSFTKSLSSGLLEGLFLSFTILGTILFIGTVALLVVKHTNLLDLLGAPLVPLLELLNIPDAKMVAPAVVAGASEMYLPALMTKGAEVKAKFFVAVLSISQLIFFSSCAPMMMTMFPTVPITFLHLIYLFALRTMILIPLIALIAQLMEWLSYF